MKVLMIYCSDVIGVISCVLFPGVRDGMTDLSTSVSEVDTAVSGDREDREEEQPPPPPPPPDALTSPQSSNLTSQHNTPAATQVCVYVF